MVYKTKAIQANLGIFMHILAYWSIFRHIQAWSGIFRNYSGIFKTLGKPLIFRTQEYSEPEGYPESWNNENSGIFRTRRHIQNPGIFRTLIYPEPWYIQNPGILRTKVYSEPWHVENQRHIQNCFKHVIMEHFVKIVHSYNTRF